MLKAEIIPINATLLNFIPMTHNLLKHDGLVIPAPVFSIDMTFNLSSTTYCYVSLCSL
jgi:hypothetical protein